MCRVATVLAFFDQSRALATWFGALISFSNRTDGFIGIVVCCNVSWWAELLIGCLDGCFLWNVLLVYVMRTLFDDDNQVCEREMKRVWVVSWN